jgi:hypothetical protein
VARATVVVDFEEFELPATGYWSSENFTSQGVEFSNNYVDFGSGCCWEGFALSAIVDTTTPGATNQYAAIAGGGAGDSRQYAVAFSGLDAGNGGFASEISLPIGSSPVSLAVTNTTFAALSMRHGDSFSKKFGGPTGDDADFFRLRIVGFDTHDQSIGEVEFMLADYRFADNSLDYIVDDWVTVDLSELAAARVLQLRLDSSDIGPFGMNTPAYVAIDHLVLTAPLAGDFNGDSIVDVGDYTLWRDTLGSAVAAGSGADADADGWITSADYAIWRSNFGAAVAVYATTTSLVPEPNALLITLFFCCLLLRRCCS